MLCLRLKVEVRGGRIDWESFAFSGRSSISIKEGQQFGWK